MDFRFDDDELTIIGEARQTIRHYLPRERFFHGSEAQGDWPALGHGGWLHAGLAGDFGGSDLPLHVVAGIAKEAGAVLAGDAYVNNAVLIPQLLARTDDAERLLAEHLERPGFLLVDGRVPSLMCTAATSSRWCYGVEPGFVPFAIRPDGLYRYGSESVSFKSLGEVMRGLGDVVLDGGAAERFGLDADLAVLQSEAAVTSAAALVGLGEAALADTCAYVLDRHQFGGPIGRFQAIKHELANIAVELEIAWNAVLYAALLLDDAEVRIARYQAARASNRATRAMVQFFGGIGVTLEHHAHLYMKASATSAVRFGSAEAEAEALGRLLVGGAA